MLNICNFSLQVIEKSFSYFQRRFLITRTQARVINCLCDLFFDFKVVLKAWKLEVFDWILKYTYVDKVAEDPLPVIFTKVVPLSILTDENCLISMVRRCFKWSFNWIHWCMLLEVQALHRNLGPSTNWFLIE